MTKNLKYFLIPFLASIPFWWASNAMEKDLRDFFYNMELTTNPNFLAAQAGQLSLERQIRESKPFRNKNIADLEIEAKSAISILIDNNGRERILFEKEKEKQLPIASLTKLMTAKVVFDHYDLSKKIKISKEAISQEEDFGKLTFGKIYTVEYLLFPLLIESSNDAAYALANDYDGMAEKEFVQLMNEKAGNFKLQNTYFLNSTGLDPEKSDETGNYSTSLDLARLAKATLADKLLWEILDTQKYDSYGPELLNTNKLLGELPQIIGGKTGYTEKASGCFLLVLKAPKGGGYIINVILGTNDRFSEMEKLVNWLYRAYNW